MRQKTWKVGRHPKTIRLLPCDSLGKLKMWN